MLSILRKTRRQLLSNNRLAKYFVYAAGEILLVVIGILIALSVDNWNDSLNEQARVKKLQVRLKVETLQNLERSERYIALLEEELEISHSLMRWVGIPPDVPDPELFDSLINVAGRNFNISLDMNTMIEAQANGEIALITSDTLRAAIYNLLTMIDYMKHWELVANTDLVDTYATYLNRNISFRNFSVKLVPGYKEKIGPSRLDPPDYSKILMDREFENLLDARIYYQQSLLQRYMVIESHLKTIIELMTENSSSRTTASPI